MRKPARVVAILAVLLFGACSSDQPPPNTVEMVSGQRFAPGQLEVEAGTTVTFVNRSPEPHTVTAYEDGVPEGADYFASGGASSEDAAREDMAAGFLDDGEEYRVTFDEPGTYRYFCLPHENQNMSGTIVVTP